MTAERLIRLLEHPEQLDSVPYEELKTLSLAYPYSPHLKQVLLLKSKQINHHEYDRNLAAAATISPDRKKLYKLLVPSVIPVAVTVKEEILELKPLVDLRRELETVKPVERPAQVQQVISVPPPTSPQPLMIEKEPFAIENEPVISEKAPVIIEEQPLKIDETPEVIIPRAVPNLAIGFHSWVQQFNLPVIERPAANSAAETDTPIDTEPPAGFPDQEAPEKQPVKEEKYVAPRIAQQLAEKSVAEKDEVRSESLAKILVLQGYKDKAILMYQRLMLDFPEKSAIFAAAIEELKK